MAKRLWLRFGGSCRKMDKDRNILSSTFKEFREVGSTCTGHWSNRSGVINDTPENRVKIKELKGITIDKNMMQYEKA